MKRKASVAPQTGDVASAKGKSKPKATSKKPSTAKPQKDTSKQADVIAIMSRKGGATLGEVIKLTGWKNHTVRGFVSGTVGKKLGLRVESLRNAEKERVYRIITPEVKVRTPLRLAVVK